MRNTGWRENSFRGYADYTETEAFQAAAEQLIQTATGSRTAIMCAEAAWQQCHRGLISDWLRVRNLEVVHILRDGKAAAHTWTAVARVIDGHLSYAAEESMQRTLGLD